MFSIHLQRVFWASDEPRHLKRSGAGLIERAFDRLQNERARAK